MLLPFPDEFRPGVLLVGAVAAVGVLHTIIPDHWVPITLIARQRGWWRVAILEFLAVSDQICRHIVDRVTSQEIHRAGIAEGMRPMYDDGMHKVLAGVTSVEEVLRVTRAI